MRNNNFDQLLCKSGDEYRAPKRRVGKYFQSGITAVEWIDRLSDLRGICHWRHRDFRFQILDCEEECGYSFIQTLELKTSTCSIQILELNTQNLSLPRF